LQYDISGSGFRSAGTADGWGDALIVAAAVRTGSRWLLTDDLQGGQDLMGVTVLSPFDHPPEDLLGS
jgi:predicted nucleic acid-binding protein